MPILCLEGIFWKLNEHSLSLQNHDVNIVYAKQIIKAFMNKFVMWKMKAMTHKFCHFPSFGCKEIDCESQAVIGNHLSFLHDNIQSRF